MEITVDGKQHMLLHAKPATVGVALLEINDYLLANGRALQSIVADGRNVPPEEIAGAFSHTPISEINTLEIGTADFLELVAESVAELAEVVPELHVACQELAGILSGEAPHEGMPGIGQLLEIWTALKERKAEIVKSLGLDAGVLDVAGVSLLKHEQDLDGLLDTTRAAVEASDFVKLAELLAYDLSTFAEREADIIARLQSKVQPPSP